MKATKTYFELMALVESDEAFFFKDFPYEDRVYCIFNYRLASWTSFQKPGAMNCRGIMYDVTTDEPKLVSLPMEKFFNFEEGNVDHYQCRMRTKMVKMDGSLISTYLHNGKLMLKSKGALFSEQAIAAMNWLNREENRNIKDQIQIIVSDKFTVNFEYSAPWNRIVCPYQEEKLTLLSITEHANFKNYFGVDVVNLLLKLNVDDLIPLVVECMYEGGDIDEELKNIRAEQEGEGYVIEFVRPDQTSYLVKVKTDKYLSLHRAKDSAYTPKRLFECVLDEATDDLRSMFHDDAYVLNMITDMENRVQPVYNHIIEEVENFFETNKGLDRKTYAILAQKEQPKLMGLLMLAYLNRPIDYKEFSKKNMKELFGISGETQMLMTE
jgi:T4 RnlA family RNA ligase